MFIAEKPDNRQSKITGKHLAWLFCGVLFWAVLLAPLFRLMGYRSGYLANVGWAFLSISLCVYCLLCFGMKLPKRGEEFGAFFYPILGVLFAVVLALLRKIFYGGTV